MCFAVFHARFEVLTPETTRKQQQTTTIQMAARKGHPALCRMPGLIAQRVANESAAAAAETAKAAAAAAERRRRRREREALGGGVSGIGSISFSGSGGDSSQEQDGDEHTESGSGGSSGGKDLPPLGHDAGVLMRTGPGIWSLAVHAYIREAGAAPEALARGGRAGDCLVLPQLAFGCSVRYWSPDNKESLVVHFYKYSWKVDNFKIADARKAARAAKRRARARRRAFAWALGGAAASAVVWAAARAARGGGGAAWALKKRRRADRED